MSFNVYDAEKQSPPELEKSEILVFRTYKWLLPRWRYYITNVPTMWEFNGDFYRYENDKVWGWGLTRKSATRRANRRYRRAVRRVYREWAYDQQEYRYDSPVPAASDLR